MRIISFCAEGIKDAADHGFYEWVVEQDADIICIQDLKAQEYDLVSDIFFPSPYNAYFYDDIAKNSNGVALYTKLLPKAIMTGLAMGEMDQEGRYIQADFDRISIGCLLAPAADADDADAIDHKNRFYDQLLPHLEKIRHKRREYIICGNWNIAHGDSDVSDPEAFDERPGFQEHERAWLDDIFGPLGYIDAFREVNGDPDEFTWWPGGHESPEAWRVDYQIVSEGLRNAIEYGAVYKNQNFSRHAPLIMDYDYEL